MSDRRLDMAESVTVEELHAEIERLQEIIRGLTGQDEQPIEGLTAGQARIARALERANGRTLSRFTLLDALSWDSRSEEPDLRFIDHYVKMIRKKRPDIGRRIKTHYGFGYAMLPEVRDA